MNKLIKNQNFLSYLNETQETCLITVSFEVTSYCNFKCCHCYVKHNFQESLQMDIALIKRVISQMADYGVQYISITGGEPFMRKDILEILRFAKEKNLGINLRTNAYMLNEEIINELARLEIDEILVSIYGTDDREYCLVTESKHELIPFTKIKENLVLMRKVGINLKLRFIPLIQNYKGIRKYFELCSELNIDIADYYVMLDIYPSNDYGTETIYYGLNDEQFDGFLTEIYEYDQDFFMQDNNMCIKRCIGAIYTWNKGSSFKTRNENFCKNKISQAKTIRRLLNKK